MSIIKHVTLQKIVAHDFRYGPRTIQALVGRKKNAQETYLWSVLQDEGKCWTEFYKYLKRRKENMENILALKD